MHRLVHHLNIKENLIFSPQIIYSRDIPQIFFSKWQVHMEEIMKLPEGFLPVIKNCLDEDYFLDVRRATSHVMYQFLRVGGLILSGNEAHKIVLLL